MFHHLAHFDDILVKEGQQVRRGQLIGYIGNTGSSTAPHSHYEIKKVKPDSWRQYVQGMSREEVAKAYVDPEIYIDEAKHIPAKYDRKTGYGYLQPINGTNMFHPGVDINSGNSGWADYRMPVVAPCDGVVIHMDEDGRNGGWGYHLWIEELFEAQPTTEDGAKFARDKYGFYIQVQEHGELWVVGEDGYREYLKDMQAVRDWVERVAVGISNEDLAKIPKRK